MLPGRVLAVSVLFVAVSAQEMQLPIRSRVQPFKGDPAWVPVETLVTVPAHRTAVIICDMWDRHWCGGASTRTGELARAMVPVLARAREAGIRVIHAPSETMDFYRDAPQRQAMLRLPRMEPPLLIALTAPPLPIDDSKGGCETGESFYKAWTREHPAIPVEPQDRISDNSAEIYAFLKEQGIGNLLVMGVHTNMCILNRSFAIKRMTQAGVRCILVRDLTDSMYDPRERPFVPHAAGTELVIEHIEKYWAPSTTSVQLLTALRNLH